MRSRRLHHPNGSAPSRSPTCSERSISATSCAISGSINGIAFSRSTAAPLGHPQALTDERIGTRPHTQRTPGDLGATPLHAYHRAVRFELVVAPHDRAARDRQRLGQRTFRRQELVGTNAAVDDQFRHSTAELAIQRALATRPLAQQLDQTIGPHSCGIGTRTGRHGPGQ